MRELFFEVDKAYGTLTGTMLERRLLELLNECAEKYGRRCLPYASMLSELGGYYRGQRLLDCSERHFREAVELIGELKGAGCADYATAVNNLAGTHRLMGEFDKAQEEFETCLRIYGATVGTNHILYASGLNNLSLVCLDRGDLEQAAQLQRRAADVLRDLPECVDEFASCLCNTAAIYSKMKRFSEAKDLYRQAIHLFETKLGTKTPHYHAALNGLGLVYCARTETKSAVEVFRKALCAAESLYGTGHPEYLDILNNLHRAERERMA